MTSVKYKGGYSCVIRSLPALLSPWDLDAKYFKISFVAKWTIIVGGDPTEIRDVSMDFEGRFGFISYEVYCRIS